MAGEGRLCIGLVTYNSAADLPACLHALAAQSIPLRLLAWDNASSDESAAWLENQSPIPVELIRSPHNVGYGRAHNALIQRAALRPGDAWLVLNPDVILAPDYCARLWQGLREGGAGWGTGLLLRRTDPATLYSAGHAMLRDGYAFHIGAGLPDEPRWAQTRAVFGAPGCAALYTAEFLRDVAPDGEVFDARFFLYGEDVDLDWRGQRRGWRCLCVGAARAQHRGSVPTPDLQAQALAHRHLSALKNAHWRDLLTLNLPLLGAHLLLRLLLTPRQGAQMARLILRCGPGMRKKRLADRASRAQMLDWFAWAAQQPTQQPRRLSERWRAFRSRSAG